MVGNGKSPVLVVVQLSGGNDFMNTLIPYANPIYHDTRKTLGVPEDQVVHLNDTLGFHPSLWPSEGPLRRGQDGHRPGDRLPGCQPFPL